MQFESEEHEKAWLIVTASNTCKDELRRWKRRLENIKSLYAQENVARKEDGRVIWKEPPDFKLLCVTGFHIERTMKGSFNPVTLNVGRIEEYHEWDYSTKSGQI